MKNLIAIFTLFLGVLAYAEKPNVLLIYVDDMGYGDVSFGDKNCKIQTPHIDALAESGMTLCDGHSSSGLCSSSRYSILTGKYHWRRFYGIVYPFQKSIFEENEFTMATMFKKKGYKTAIIGKWHLGWDWQALEKDSYTPHKYPERPKGASRDHYPKYNCDDLDWTKSIPSGPTSLGFDYYFGDDVVCFPPYCWIENDKVTSIPTKMVTEDFLKVATGDEGNYRGGAISDDWSLMDVLPMLTRKAISYISEQSAGEPFFLYLPLSSPHAPIVPTPEFQGTSDAGAYGDFVQQTDDSIGQIISALEKKGLRDNTIIIFTSDNGACEYTYKRLKETGHWSSGKFRGIKRDIYEGGHHVPFIVSWKGRVKAGTTSDALISQVDLLATFANIIGYDLSKDEALDSFNQLDVWESKDLKSPVRTETIHNTMKGKYALRQGDWVYMNTSSGSVGKADKEYNVAKASKQKTKTLLYNLKDDISQKNNLTLTYPEIVQSMSKTLDKYLKSEATAPHTK